MKAFEDLEKQVGDSKQTSQSALYEKEQQLTSLQLELDKVIPQNDKLFIFLIFVGFDRF